MPHIVSERADHVRTIALNRPAKLNAFVGTMREELLDALLDAARDQTCRVVVLTGAGRAFCSGGDVEAMAAMQKQRDVSSFRRLLDAGREIVTTIAEMPQPVIASINGVAAGAGCNLALACDYRLASTEARLGETFVRIGMHPDWGGTWLLPRLVGPSRAFELLATGRMVDAEEALRIGLVDRLVAPDQLQAETRELAAAIAAGPPSAVRDIKRALNRSARNDLRHQLELESEHQVRALLSTDAAEGMAAFFDRRAPRFTGE